MPNWYPVLHQGNRDYAYDLPQRIRHRFLGEARSLRDDYPADLPIGGITGFDWLDRGTGYAAGEIVGVDGGNNDALARTRLISVGGGSIVALDFISLGTGYQVGQAALTGGSGSDGAILILEVA